VIKRLLAKVDVTSDSLETIPNAAWRHMELGLPESEMQKLRAHIDATYEAFKSVVSQGRNMTMDAVENVAQGQVYTGSQAISLGLVDELGGLEEALLKAGAMSLEATAKDADSIRELMDERGSKDFADWISGGSQAYDIVKEQLAKYQTEEPSPAEIRKILDNVRIAQTPQIHTVVFPAVNIGNEVLGIAIGAAFQSDDDRSPIPVDQPVSDPSGGDGSEYSQGRFVVGALFGLARANNIPLWQYPMFCYWYAAQGARIHGDTGSTGALLNTWFGKILKEHSGLNVSGQGTKVFAKKGTAWDIRLEMPPFEIFF
jgi:hypothetical protein